jgi:hypothetical protein
MDNRSCAWRSAWLSTRTTLPLPFIYK